MRDLQDLLKGSWFTYLDNTQQQLVGLAFELYQREHDLQSQWHDYSFVVFPISKAYEGFLKKFLFDVGLINEVTYSGRKFRIGRALNPDVGPAQRDEFWLFDNLERSCGTEMARQVWETWLRCRNRVFHYFPQEKNTLSLQESGEYLHIVAKTIEQALFCRPSLLRSNNHS